MDRAFAFIEELERVNGIMDLLALLSRTLASFGFEYFTFQDMPDPRRYDDFLFLQNVPEEWLKLYVDQKYNAVDPAFRKHSGSAKIISRGPYGPSSCVGAVTKEIPGAFGGTGALRGVRSRGSVRTIICLPHVRVSGFQVLARRSSCEWSPSVCRYKHPMSRRVCLCRVSRQG